MTMKLKEVTIEYVKNVDYGQISFVDKGKFLNVVGLYGQNGSGKTTLIDGMGILQRLLLNQPLDESFTGMLNQQDARITVDIVEVDEVLLRYVVVLRKVASSKGEVLQVVQEQLSTRQLEKYKKMKQLVSFNAEDDQLVSFNISDKAGSLDALQVISDVVAEKQTSFLFSSSFSKLLGDKKAFQPVREALVKMRNFGQNLRLYTSEFAGLISANIIAPVSVNYHEGEKEIHGILPFRLRGESGYVPGELVSMYEKIVAQMNILLPEIIPGLSLELVQRDVRMDRDGQEEVQLDFLSKRGDTRFSLHYESDGVKKIIALINYLVEVYNDSNIIAFVDELDAGIYEYLLGELIDVMASGGKGQLIFTSHNLRILEMLDTNKIVVSTTNPKNRYIRLKGVKGTNNLRDFYLRTIQLSGQEEELYQGKSTSALRIALMKAGRKNG